MMHVRYLNKRMKSRKGIYNILLLLLCFLSACGSDGQVQESRQEETTQIFVSSEQEVEEQGADKVFVEEMYSYEVEEKAFSFYTDETVYTIPYVRISGCPDEQLQWRINHMLWEEACWIFECAELEDGLYRLFEGESAVHIAGVYQYEQFLSVVYAEEEDNYYWPEKIVYAIVVDTLTGERVLLADMIKDSEVFEDLLLHYFDDDLREIRLFITEDKVEEILLYGGMTEDETVRYNFTCDGEHPEWESGNIISISYIFDASSFYMTEDSFVVLPGADYFEELIFEWESISEAVYTADEW